MTLDEARAAARQTTSDSETYRNIEYLIRTHAPKNLTDFKLRRKWRPITPEETAAIIAASTRGDTYSQISEHFGRTDGQIAKILK